MSKLLFNEELFQGATFRRTADYILQTQLENGCIPWFKNGKADPWDHIEAAMGLTVAGEYTAAKKAYRWLAHEQLNDGSWWAHYSSQETLAEYGVVDKDHRETNFIAYIATGVWHYFLVTQDRHFLQELFPVIRKAIDFVLRYQSPNGEIYWAVSENGSAKQDALVTACASVYKSIECAVLSARELAEDCDAWLEAYTRLGKTLREHPECFDRTWESKARFSMDWFYPVLTGVLKGAAAKARLDLRWNSFVENNMGCRCVSDEPWVTVAESCELTLALLAANEPEKALALFNGLHQFVDADGGYWTGYNFRDAVIWPLEKTTWTAGVILLAADALTQHTAAANLFTQHKDLLPVRECVEV